MADDDSWDADNFEPDEPIKKAVVLDKWEGEDEEDNVKDNWDDEDEDEKVDIIKEVKSPEEKTITEKTRTREKENLERVEDDQTSQSKDNDVLPPEEQLAEQVRAKELQQDADLRLKKEPFGVTNHVPGIDAMSPSSREDFSELEKLLKEKIVLCEKSVHYCAFLESLFRDLCLSLEVEDLKKINNSLTVLLSEKQKQEKQNKPKKKKRSVLPGGGLKAKLKDDLVDYGDFDGGYAQDYEDFM